MHNVFVNGSGTPASRRTRFGAGLAAVVLGLTACSGGSAEETGAAPPEDASSAGDSAEATPTPTAEPYLPVPDGVELTPQGSLLDVGDQATVAYELPEGQIGVLGLTVRRLRETTFEESFEGWQLDAQTRRSTPYFVDVRVTNKGRSNLGGRAVPLYLLDDAKTLIEASTFAGDFEPCPSDPLPERFRRGDTTRGCLVFLAPRGRELAGVSFRPDQDFEAITWAGEVAKPGGNEGKRGRNEGKRGGNDGKRGDNDKSRGGNDKSRGGNDKSRGGGNKGGGNNRGGGNG